MANPLEGIRLKLIRAEQHLNAVAEAFNSYRYGTFHVITEYDSDSGYRIIRLQLPHPKLDTSVVIGDCAHNMRSALDHLVWQLVRANGKTPSGKNMFPICTTLSNFTEEIRRERLLGVSTSAHTLIDALQPYHRGQPLCDLHPLWILSKLANIDKHRTLNVTTVLADTVDFQGFGLHIDVVSAEMADGAIILRDKPDRIYENMDVNAQGTMFVAFQDVLPKNRGVVIILQEILDFLTKTALPGFESFFN